MEKKFIYLFLDLLILVGLNEGIKAMGVTIPYLTAVLIIIGCFLTVKTIGLEKLILVFKKKVTTIKTNIKVKAQLKEKENEKQKKITEIKNRDRSSQITICEDNSQDVLNNSSYLSLSDVGLGVVVAETIISNVNLENDIENNEDQIEAKETFSEKTEENNFDKAVCHDYEETFSFYDLD